MTQGATFEAAGGDGRRREILRAAVCAFQEKRGMTPDGYPTLALLKNLEGD